MKKVCQLLLLVSASAAYAVAHSAIPESLNNALSGKLVSRAAAVQAVPYKISSFKKVPEQNVVKYTPVSNVHTLNEQRLGHEITYGVYMIENIRGGNNQPAYACQDTAFAGALVGKAVFAVCDGHGTFGDRISQETVKNLPVDVLKHKDVEQGMKLACKAAQEKYLKASYARRSGTTMVCGVIQNKDLIIGNVGDSRLVVIRPSRHSIAFSTVDHKGVSGRLLALSRSLGDVEMHKLYGLSAEPELGRLALEENDIIILASDGYWDVVTNQQTYELVMQGFSEGLDCKALSKKLAETARIRKSKDDITVLCVQYKKTPALSR